MMLYTRCPVRMHFHLSIGLVLSGMSGVSSLPGIFGTVYLVYQLCVSLFIICSLARRGRRVAHKYMHYSCACMFDIL